MKGLRLLGVAAALLAVGYYLGHRGPEQRPAAGVVPEEWEWKGDYAAVPNAYNVRPIE